MLPTVSLGQTPDVLSTPLAEPHPTAPIPDTPTKSQQQDSPRCGAPCGLVKGVQHPLGTVTPQTPVDIPCSTHLSPFTPWSGVVHIYILSGLG